MKDKKVLVLGSEGMLGREVLKNLIDKKYDIYSTYRGSSYKDSLDQKKFNGINNFDARDFLELSKILDEINPHIVINSIGIIKQLKKKVKDEDFFLLNSLLPKYLEYWCETNKKRLIHFSTDCVFDGERGMYLESDWPNARDLYGRTKLLGEVVSDNSITLRTSIIGHEIGSSQSLLEWFLRQTGDSVNGYSKAIFSGLPTVELARVIHDYVICEPSLNGLYHVSSDPINKYELLKLIAKEYSKEIEISREDSIIIDRSLDSSKFREATNFQPSSWKEMVAKMRRFG